jgi:ubiquinone/menaquinone biosynthesis C-methylase UbiE
MAIKEMSRVLKKNGLLLVTVDFAPIKMIRKAYTKADILNLISASQLSFDNRYDFDIEDWEAHLKELTLFFNKKKVCETSTAAFLLKK